MGLGFFRAEVRAGGGILPIQNAKVIVQNRHNIVFHELTTDESGNTRTVEIDAPNIEHTLNPNDTGPFYTQVDVIIEHPNFNTVIVRGVQIFDKETSILPVNMTPKSLLRTVQPTTQEFVIPEDILHSSEERLQETSEGINPRLLREVFIPETITVHLGRPDAPARNVTVPFVDYIKNVASSEIYPTWPLAALEANIYCQISFALNRIYTEWYRVRGHNFDITNSTQFDQFFVEGRNIFQNISVIVDRIFNQYIRRQGRREPFFAQYCNGTTSTCAGLSQWGTVPLANAGRNPLQILRNFYPNDIEIVTSNVIQGITESYPGTPLREGDTRREVQTMQFYLNRIRQNFPLIPRIQNVNGTFGSDTVAAVRTFQQIFDLPQDGIIGRATWNSISRLYSSVKRLSDLQSEGELIGIGRTPPTTIIRQGTSSPLVSTLQLILNFIGEFYSEIPPVNQDGNFNAQTTNAVLAFQALFGLTTDGIVGPNTWNRLYQVYWNIEDIITETPTTPPITPPVVPPVTPPTVPPNTPPYPGTLLRVGSSGESVRVIQNHLNAISSQFPSIPRLSVDGAFGPITQSAVMAFQRQFGLVPDGIIGPITWAKIMEVFSGLNQTPQPPAPPQATMPPYPGYLIREGQRSEDVRTLQTHLNVVSASHPQIPRLATDGIFGPNTRRAVIEFQRIFGLTQDAIVGPLTWNRLMQESANLGGGISIISALSTMLIGRMFLGR